VGPGIAGALSLLAFSALGLVPFFGVLLVFLAPLPLAHVAGGGRPSFVAWGWVAVSLAGVVLLTGSTLAAVALVGYLLVAAWPVVAAELWARHSWDTGRWAALVAGVPFGVVSLLLLGVAFPAPPAEPVAGFLVSAAEGSQELAFRIAGRSAETEDLFRWLVPVIASLVPALCSMFVLAVALWLRRRLPLLGFPVGASPFAGYRSEEWLPAAFVTAALGWVFLGGHLKWLSGNLLAVVFGLYFVHGVAIILFHLGRRLGENRWMRGLVVVFGLQLPVAFVIAALGLVDVFVTLRRGERRE